MNGSSFIGLSLVLVVTSWVVAQPVNDPTMDQIQSDLARKLPEEFDILGPNLFQAVIQRMVSHQRRNSDSSRVCHGRLTLTSGTAVTTSDVTAATTVYFAPFNGAHISLYSGSVWQLVAFSEVSVAVPSTTVTPFDIFAYNNSGTVTLETVNWTNDTTRATALTTQNGVYVKTGATTRRYLGTGRTTGSSGQIEDSDSKRFLWNECNRVPRKVMALSTTDSWDYGTSVWRAANNDTTTGITRVEFVLGQVVEPVKFQVYAPEILAAGVVNTSDGIGIDDTASTSSDVWEGTSGTSSTPLTFHFARYIGNPAVGYHYAQWVEYGNATTVTHYTNSQTGGAQRKAGLTGDLWG